MSEQVPRPVPPATVARLPRYLRALDELVGEVATASSEQLAAMTGVGSAQLRRDLSHLGPNGVRGVGYDVARLREQVASALGLAADLPVIIVGIGNLGHALASYMAGGRLGFRVAALVDADPAVVGTTVAGLRVEREADLAVVVRRERVALAVIATPAEVAQDVCDRLCDAGVHAILTFAPRELRAREGVEVRAVDLATELQILAFHERRRTMPDAGGGGGGGGGRGGGGGGGGRGG
ncbi:redox-sensing transcriptional repressor Rex, partial [Actinotalea sp. M2MS4P-6]|uniref:redox-sensing transcriptional repressor Rex n=1 Tax=Actinotalea sp. M2MS4P-6 TaxID=2983762 RepID=UPI0021E40DED